MSNYKRQLLPNDQQGLVAIVVTLIFLIVISLTSLGLARFARREQRQTLDNQLASQANYLAEAGINDAIKATQPGGIYADVSSDKTTCDTNNLLDQIPPLDPDNNFNQLRLLNPIPLNFVSEYITNNLGITARGEYSCVLINHTASTLEYKPVPTHASRYGDMQIVNNDGSPISTAAGFYLVIGWQEDTSNDDFEANGNSFPSMHPSAPAAGKWTANTTPILRVDITKTNNLDRNYQDTNTATAFLLPQSGSGTPITTNFTDIAGWTNRGKTIHGQCTNAGVNLALKRLKFCNAVIFIQDTDKIFLRMKSIYGVNSEVTVAAYNAANVQGKIKGAQILIDSTGKVADVVKRLQARVNTTPDYTYPEYAIESGMAICKLISAAPPPVGSSGDTTGYDSSASSNDKDVCNPAIP